MQRYILTQYVPTVIKIGQEEKRGKHTCFAFLQEQVCTLVFAVILKGNWDRIEKAGCCEASDMKSQC